MGTSAETRVSPIEDLDFTKLLSEKRSPLADVRDRADARSSRFVPVTPEERLTNFIKIGYRPHGMFVPSDLEGRAELMARAHGVGAVEHPGARMKAYFSLQDETELWELAGVPGRWTGQQAIARSKAPFRLVAFGRRSGKALALDTRIPTPDGWSTMGDLTVGDTVFGDDGKPCTVVYATDVMYDHECYDVYFSDGQVITADADHRWLVEDHNTRKSGSLSQVVKGKSYYKPDVPPKILTTKQMAGEVHYGVRKDNNLSIRVSNPVQCDEKDFSVDPYVLGVWLGDGCSVSTVISVPDEKFPILDEMQVRGVSVKRYKTAHGKVPTYKLGKGLNHSKKERDGSLQAELNRLGVLGSKHIPASYLRGSIQQRLDLLHGLMDTDGYCDTGGHVIFTSTDRALADGVKELLESLGQKAVLTESRAKLNGKDYGECFDVYCNPTLPVFTLPYKLVRQKLDSDTPRLSIRSRRYITDIVPRPSVPVRCITVDSPSHLYLAGNFIPTHNTYHAAREAVALAMFRPRSWTWIAAPTMDLVSRSFDMVVVLLSDLGIKPSTLRNSAQEKLIILPNGAKIEGVSLDKPGSAAGAAVDFVLIDEAAQVGEDAFVRDILPPLTDRNGQALLISSWEGEGNFFHDQAERAANDTDGDWEMFTGASWDNFFEFPQGRKSPKIQRQERLTPALDFLEQYGAIPSRKKGKVFPEFKEKVHVGNFPFNPEHPVKLAVDPSGGVAPYAVAVLQDYGDLLIQIDEFYEAFVTAEQVVARLKTRPWWDKVTDVVMDSASPQEIWRWGGMGCPAFPVPEKPQVWVRLPYVRRLLRNPAKFHDFYRAKVNSALEQMGHPPDIDKDLPPEKQRALAIQVEESMSDQNLTVEDIDELRKCSKFFINQSTCPNSIQEYKNYAYGKERKTKDPNENPMDKSNHITDAHGYYAWTYKRDENNSTVSVSYLAYKTLMDAPVGDDTAVAVGQNREPGGGWLGEVRGMFIPRTDPLSPRSYLRVIK